MNELGKFQLRLATRHSTALTIGHATLASLVRRQGSDQIAHDVPIRSEWRDPIALRISGKVQGSRSNG